MTSVLTGVPTSTGPAAALAAAGAEVATAVRPGSLSPSRVADFLSCPLLYRFRVLDRLPEPPSRPAARGTVVHAALERLFDLPAAERSLDRAADLLAPAWDAMVADDPGLLALLDDDPGPGRPDALLAEARDLLDAYFSLEDPRRLEPAERELLVELPVEFSGQSLLLRGYVDRLDRAPDGALRVVDYKTGRAPAPGFEAKAMFQMRFYALVLWRTHGVVPRVLQLMYLGSHEVLRFQPDEADLLATERKLAAVWQALARALDRGDFRPSPSRLCDWCSHQSCCPAFGGSAPPMPALVLEPAASPGPGPAAAGGLAPSAYDPGDEV